MGFVLELHIDDGVFGGNGLLVDTTKFTEKFIVGHFCVGLSQ